MPRILGAVVNISSRCGIVMSTDMVNNYEDHREVLLVETFGYSTDLR